MRWTLITNGRCAVADRPSMTSVMAHLLIHGICLSCSTHTVYTYIMNPGSWLQWRVLAVVVFTLSLCSEDTLFDVTQSLCRFLSRAAGCYSFLPAPPVRRQCTSPSWCFVVAGFSVLTQGFQSFRCNPWAVHKRAHSNVCIIIFNMHEGLPLHSLSPVILPFLITW